MPLWTLLVASEALDLLSAGFAAAGIEQLGATQASLHQGLTVLVPGSFPWSHGLLISLVWSVLTAALTYALSRDRRASAILGLVVLGHWFLDCIVHPPDLPLFFADSPRVGLGLWSSGPGFVVSILLEIVLLAGGSVLYAKARQGRSLLSRNRG